MMDSRTMHTLVEEALAFAHAAIDETTPYRVAEARTYAAEVLPCIARIKPKSVALGEARELYVLVGQLRAVLGVLERKLELQSCHRSN